MHVIYISNCDKNEIKKQNYMFLNLNKYTRQHNNKHKHKTLTKKGQKRSYFHLDSKGIFFSKTLQGFKETFCSNVLLNLTVI